LAIGQEDVALQIQDFLGIASAESKFHSTGDAERPGEYLATPFFSKNNERRGNPQMDPYLMLHVVHLSRYGSNWQAQA